MLAVYAGCARCVLAVHAVPRVSAHQRWSAFQFKYLGGQYRIRTYVLIDTTIACPIEAVSCHYLRNGLADVGQVTGEVIRYEQPEPMRL